MKQLQLLEIWFSSDLRHSAPGLVMQTTCAKTGKYYTIGVYLYNSITRRSGIDPLPGCEKMSEKELLKKIQF